MRNKDYIDTTNINSEITYSDDMYFAYIRDFYRTHPKCDDFGMKVSDIIAVENDPNDESFIQIRYRMKEKEGVLKKVHKATRKMSKHRALQLVVSEFYDDALASGYVPSEPKTDYTETIRYIDNDENFMYSTARKCFSMSGLGYDIEGGLDKKKEKLMKDDPSGYRWKKYVESYRDSYEKNRIRMLVEDNRCRAKFGY